MTYEEYLDEVTTLITERFNVSDEAAIKQVMRAQADGFFSLHDDHPEMRTQERAEQDAKTVYEQGLQKSGGPQAGQTAKTAQTKKARR